IATRSPRSARQSGRAVRWHAVPIARSDQRAPASPRSRPSSRRAASPSTRPHPRRARSAAETASMTRFSRAQAVSLVLLRTLIGWHFLYEGYYKLVLPAWSASGQPLGHWSAAGYLRAATGPLAGAFYSPGRTPPCPWGGNIQ